MAAPRGESPATKWLQSVDVDLAITLDAFCRALRGSPPRTSIVATAIHDYIAAAIREDPSLQGRLEYERRLILSRMETDSGIRLLTLGERKGSS